VDADWSTNRTKIVLAFNWVTLIVNIKLELEHRENTLFGFDLTITSFRYSMND